MVRTAARKARGEQERGKRHSEYCSAASRTGIPKYGRELRAFPLTIQQQKDIVVFWGSQSGTAERFAHALGTELHQRFHVQVLVADLSDFDAATITLIPRSKLAIFLLSTYGEGDPSDNTTDFWDWLTKLREVVLLNLRYAAFGLGNSDYKYFNRVVVAVDELLRTAGAEQLIPIGKADDAKAATQEDFLLWKEGLFNFLRDGLNLQEHDLKYEPSVAVIEDGSLQPADLHVGEPLSPQAQIRTGPASSVIRPLTIKQSRELFTCPSRNCIHMELDLQDHPQMTYKTGDHLAIWPTNPDEEVDRLLNALGLANSRHVPIHIKALEPSVKLKLPTPTTVEALFRYYIEICAPVSRDTVKSLAQFAPSSRTKARLESLSRDKETYAELLTHTHINIGRLLELATKNDSESVWSGLPLTFLIETFPITQPRYYSISSSSVLSPRAPSITALVSNTSLAGNQENSIPGLTTSYLLALSKAQHDHIDRSSPAEPTYKLEGPADLLKGGKVFAHIRRSKFKLPMQSACPLIMVAAGTGLAPFRAFVAERARLQSIGRSVGEMVLFFGCRHPHEDFIYQDELGRINESLGGKLKIVTAFSRLVDGEKVYVQDRVRENGKLFSRMLLGDGANLYICGRASMAREVGKRIGEIIGEEQHWNEADVKDWSEGMKRKRKWQEDVWG